MEFISERFFREILKIKILKFLVIEKGKILIFPVLAPSKLIFSLNKILREGYVYIE